jgi:iron uptake system EfeUOB component EfeO/EfeM
VVATLLVAAGACACGSAAAGSPRSDADAGAVAATTARHPGAASAGSAARSPDATLAVKAFRTDIGETTTAFVTEVGRLQADLAAGDVTAAKADELAAQADFDGFRLLETDDTINASTLDGTVNDLTTGQSFGGLHAVERDLWTSGDALADASGLEAQAPVAQFLLSKLALPPEAIGTTGVDELGWVDDVAIPGREELYSHLDAVDIAATVAAADRAFATIEPLARGVSPNLEATVAQRFATLEFEVAALGNVTRLPDSSIPTVTRLALSQQVDSTASALAQLSATLARFGTPSASS